MDRTDLKILAILQEDASLPVAEIAKRVNLSQTPVLAAHPEAGAGRRDRAAGGAAEPGGGRRLPHRVRGNPDRRPFGRLAARFEEAVRALPQVMDVYRMAGDVDYLLRAAVGSMAEYDALYRTLIATLPLKKVTSRFAMERVKSSTAYPIAPGAATGRGGAAAA
jgi:Lrp/AsnC family transcriptional regulator